MFIVAIEGKEEDGAYSVENEDGEQVLYIFEEEDDAVRYALLLEEDGCPKMHVIEVDNDVVIETCEYHGHEYSIITKEDIVIPPQDHDFVS